MAGIVDAVAREEIQNAPAVTGTKLCSAALFIADVHLQYVEQSDPLWIYAVGIKGVEGAGRISRRQAAIPIFDRNFEIIMAGT
jgi:hypothetical protein